MSLRATTWAFEQSIPPTPKFVLVALADHADDRGRCWPSVARLEQRTGFKERAVRNALRELEEMGLIVTERRDGFMSRYTLALGSVAVAVLPSDAPADHAEGEGEASNAGVHLVQGGTSCRGASAASPPGTSCLPPGIWCRGPRHQMPPNRQEPP